MVQTFFVVYCIVLLLFIAKNDVLHDSIAYKEQYYDYDNGRNCFDLIMEGLGNHK